MRPKFVGHSPKQGEIFISRSYLQHPPGAYHDSAALCTEGPEAHGLGFACIYLGDPPPSFNTTGGGDSLPMPEAEQEVWRKKRQDICYASTVDMVA